MTNIVKVITYKTKGGLVFANEADAQKHLLLSALLNDPMDDLASYGKIEDGVELINWFEEKNFLDIKVVKKYYGEKQ